LRDGNKPGYGPNKKDPGKIAEGKFFGDRLSGSGILADRLEKLAGIPRRVAVLQADQERIPDSLKPQELSTVIGHLERNETA